MKEKPDKESSVTNDVAEPAAEPAGSRTSMRTPSRSAEKDRRSPTGTDGAARSATPSGRRSTPAGGASEPPAPRSVPDRVHVPRDARRPASDQHPISVAQRLLSQQRLAGAMLRQAHEDLRRLCAKRRRTGGDNLQLRELHEYIVREDDRYVLSFGMCCEVLGLDTVSMRRRFLESWRSRRP